MSTHWLYYKKTPETPSKQQLGCCAGLAWENLNKMEYLGKINGKLTNDHIAFWVRFIRKLLVDDNLKWSYKIEEKATGLHSNAGVPTRCVLWTMGDPLSPSRVHNLFYLTAFRYPEEWPQLIERLYNDRALAEDPDSMFRLFQSIHAKTNGCNNSDRSLIRGRSVYGPSSNTPIPLARFLNNLRKGTSSVQSLFS